MLKVAETFISINGEGTRAGELAYFVRFKGCNLACSYCDTKWANLPDAPCTDMTADEICAGIFASGIKNVTLTGGEPLLQKDISELITMLIKSGLRVEIETNGSVCLQPFAELEARPVFTMDYKLPSSGMEDKMCLKNFELLNGHDTVKFVSGSINDLEKAFEIISRYDLINRCHVYFSPVFGSIEPAEMVEWMKEKKLNGARLQLQLHKFIWVPEKRGV